MINNVNLNAILLIFLKSFHKEYQYTKLKFILVSELAHLLIKNKIFKLIHFHKKKINKLSILQINFVFQEINTNNFLNNFFLHI
jgi:hypothetical protein